MVWRASIRESLARTLQRDYAQGLMIVLWGERFLTSEVPLQLIIKEIIKESVARTAESLFENKLLEPLQALAHRSSERELGAQGYRAHEEPPPPFGPP